MKMILILFLFLTFSPIYGQTGNKEVDDVLKELAGKYANGQTPTNDDIAALLKAAGVNPTQAGADNFAKMQQQLMDKFNANQSEFFSTAKSIIKGVVKSIPIIGDLLGGLFGPDDVSDADTHDKLDQANGTLDEVNQSVSKTAAYSEATFKLMAEQEKFLFTPSNAVKSHPFNENAKTFCTKVIEVANFYLNAVDNDKHLTDLEKTYAKNKLTNFKISASQKSDKELPMVILASKYRMTDKDRIATLEQIANNSENLYKEVVAFGKRIESTSKERRNRGSEYTFGKEYFAPRN
jgi:septal ring factor EnvC (AmiA/AmiB activator)